MRRSVLKHTERKLRVAVFSSVSLLVSEQGTSTELVYAEGVEAPNRIVDPWCFLCNTARQNGAERIQITA